MKKPAATSQDMLLFKKIRSWLNYTLALLEIFPKKLRFTLKDKILEMTLEVLEAAIEANQVKPLNLTDQYKRLRYQNDILSRLSILDNLMQVSVEQKAISLKQLNTWATQTSEIRLMTLGWIKSDQKYAIKPTVANSVAQSQSQLAQVQTQTQAQIQAQAQARNYAARPHSVPSAISVPREATTVSPPPAKITLPIKSIPTGPVTIKPRSSSTPPKSASSSTPGSSRSPLVHQPPQQQLWHDNSLTKNQKP